MEAYAPKQKPRRGGAQAISALVSPLAGKALKRHGFTQTTLIERWPEVAGPVMAQASLPLKLGFSPGARDGGTLTLLVEPAMATRLQHGGDLLIERVNGFFGYAAVSRLKLVQGAVPALATLRRAAPPPRRTPPPEVARLPEGPLKAALLQLADTFSVDKSG